MGEQENLYCADIICHGTPSHKVLKKHIREIEEKTGKKAKELYYRKNAYLLLLLLDNERNIIYSKEATSDPWYIGFLRGLFYKEACYSCPFADRKRISDITMGDFWGLQDKEIEKRAKHGVSVMMINTEKGKKLCDMADELIEKIERTTDEAAAGNKQLRHPMPRHRNYKRFKRLNRKLSFRKAAACSLLPEQFAYAALKKIK